MTHTVYKYALLKGINTIITSRDATPLSVQVQNNHPTLYMQLEREPPVQVALDVYVIGTGFDVPEAAQKYVGTVTDKIGQVWHVYLGETRHEYPKPVEDVPDANVVETEEPTP